MSAGERTVGHAVTPMTAEALRILRAKHTRRLMDSGDTVNALLDHIEWLAAKISREENEHAELQSRCFEGFPSVSDGIFDALNEVRRAHATLLSEREALTKRVKLLEGVLKEGRRAIGDHWVPNDCYATGPVTGDHIRDLVQCPACSFIAEYDAALQVAKPAATEPTADRAVTALDHARDMLSRVAQGEVTEGLKERAAKWVADRKASGQVAKP